MSYLIPVRELGLRDSGQTIAVEDPFVVTPRQAVDAVKDFYKYVHRELAVIIALDAQDKIIDISRIMMGGIGHIPIRPRMIFTEALARMNAASIIVAHNHLTDSIKPSPEDKEFMLRIRDMGRELECELNDFIILGPTGEYWAATNETYALRRNGDRR